MAKNSSRRWLHEHFNDEYVKKAQQLGYRSRAVFKLLELQERDKLFKPGMLIIDLGAAPGGWSQVVAKCVGAKGRVIAIDILAMEPINGVEFLQGDFGEDAVLEELMATLDNARADWIISDLAPNLSGIDSVDQPRSVELAELALDLASKVLKPAGGFLVKMFQGEGFDPFLVAVRQQFKKVVIRKPKASRDRSREVYILARN
ncbi:MAG: 23S rRNA (uridine(2552)-2'-O)-methyltransferase RlmE [Pseudomonadota bacterium]